MESPCTKVCRLDPQAGLCVGCGRSLAEIGGWVSFTDAERRRVMAELPRRVAGLRPAGQVAVTHAGGAR